jgi:hypothetical protein
MDLMAKPGWAATDPVDRWRAVVDQTMTISVLGPPVTDPSEAPDGARSPDGRGDGATAVAADVAPPRPAAPSAQTCYGLPDVTLTDPVMLGSVARLVLAGVCGFAMLASIGAVIALAAGGTHGAAPYAVLGVLAGLALVAMVVLVMGLRSVTIRSGTADALAASV